MSGSLSGSIVLAISGLAGCGRLGFEPAAIPDPGDAPPSCLIAEQFPCRVLDTFDRPDGTLGAPWNGDPLISFSIETNALAFDGDTTAVLHDTVDYAADQFAFVTLADATPYFHLALRSNAAGTSFLYANVHGEVDAHVHIGFFDGGHNDLSRTNLTLRPGDQIAFAVIADIGTVYLNGSAVDTASVAGTPRAGLGGRIGLSSLSGLGATLLDDFGGGDTP